MKIPSDKPASLYTLDLVKTPNDRRSCLLVAVVASAAMALVACASPAKFYKVRDPHTGALHFSDSISQQGDTVTLVDAGSRQTVTVARAEIETIAELTFRDLVGQARHFYTALEANLPRQTMQDRTRATRSLQAEPEVNRLRQRREADLNQGRPQTPDQTRLGLRGTVDTASMPTEFVYFDGRSYDQYVKDLARRATPAREGTWMTANAAQSTAAAALSSASSAPQASMAQGAAALAPAQPTPVTPDPAALAQAPTDPKLTDPALAETPLAETPLADQGSTSLTGGQGAGTGQSPAPSQPAPQQVTTIGSEDAARTIAKTLVEGNASDLADQTRALTANNPIVDSTLRLADRPEVRQGLKRTTDDWRDWLKRMRRRNNDDSSDNSD